MTETVDYSEYGLIRLPCPKCGGEALLHPTGPDSVVVICDDCGNRGPEARRRFVDEDLKRVSARATAAWNQQAETTE